MGMSMFLDMTLITDNFLGLRAADRHYKSPFDL